MQPHSQFHAHQVDQRVLKSQNDPLLCRLCFEDCRDEPLFIQLDMFDLENTYNLDPDFSYFAERLSRLQDFVENQCPNDWKILWRDRQDVAKFWTIWAVILCGFLTLVLAIIPTVLAGLQLRSK
ncbi:hypothetical protein K505DRAFT_362060 [Melanomma pulvis-pyrius CBS 109.77]|uniref:Uncharacterized protein n=1 Tax=Melanomma pulvis-pyrius CBS 109.77 TaxID=1314802 RepID=A0A6A6XBR3_9PLEO|nr:hypothetical protein K505DRAFT_362060 [Melanomma pulvis-pyrius CBS 109.77]